MTMKPAGLVQSGMQMVGILHRILQRHAISVRETTCVRGATTRNLHHGGHDDSRLEPGQDQRSRKLGDDVSNCEITMQAD